jgi:hypothetical protein
VWLYNRYLKPKPKPVRKVKVYPNLLKPKIDIIEYSRRFYNIGTELKEIGETYQQYKEHTPLATLECLLKRTRDVRNDLASNRLIYIQLSTPKQTEAELALLVDQSIRQCDIIRDKIKELLHAHHSTR